MGEKIKRSEIVERWKKKMPKFFYWVTVVFTGVLFVSVTIHFTVESAGAMHVEWWQKIYPYIVGASAGIIAVCKFTVAGGPRFPNTFPPGRDITRRRSMKNTPCSSSRRTRVFRTTRWGTARTPL